MTDLWHSSSIECLYILKNYCWILTQILLTSIVDTQAVSHNKKNYVHNIYTIEILWKTIYYVIINYNLLH